MKKLFALVLACCMLTACGSTPAETNPAADSPETQPAVTAPITGKIVDITLDGQTVAVSDDSVYTSRDIVYYEQKTEYESGNPYGEGEDWEMHSAEEAAEHLVVNITAPGSYRLSGRLDKGQIRIDLGEDAYSDPNAVVNLILDGVEITCTVGPAILFQNVYECDGNWSVDTATPEVNTLNAGANLILAENSKNIVNGSHVAKIFKDKEGEKKLWKQDGAVYSYMSMNVWGPGTLNLTADNEGMDTELHLTIWGGDICIRSDNDGINTNEDGVSVTAIHGGNLHIIAGLGEEGDGIDSNGYLVIYGGTVVAASNPAADAGLDSDLGSYVHGGTVIALGSSMDWAESDSGQVTVNLQFADEQRGDICILQEDGRTLFSFVPAADPVLGQELRSYQGAILSCPDFRVGEGYYVFVDGIQMAYTGTDVMMRPGGMGGFGGGPRPDGGPGIPDGVTPPDEMPEPPEGNFDLPPQPSGEAPAPQGTWPEGEAPTWPEGEAPTWPEGEAPTRSEGEMHGRPQGGMHGGTGSEAGAPQSLFFMQDKVNFFTGLTAAE